MNKTKILAINAAIAGAHRIFSTSGQNYLKVVFITHDRLLISADTEIMHFVDERADEEWCDDGHLITERMLNNATVVNGSSRITFSNGFEIELKHEVPAPITVNW